MLSVSEHIQNQVDTFDSFQNQENLNEDAKLFYCIAISSRIELLQRFGASLSLQSESS